MSSDLGNAQSSKLPAEWLAGLLEREARYHGATDYKHKAAAELRRIPELERQRDQLLEVLKDMLTPRGADPKAGLANARSAIAAVEAEISKETSNG